MRQRYMSLHPAHSHIALLCNEKAGNGDAVRITAELESLLHKYMLAHTVFIGNWPAAFTGFTDIFIVGGDGTLNFFINRYPDAELPLVLFRGGTGNDFHWLLYGNTTIRHQFEQVLNTAPRPVDCGRCNERLFINGVGAGFEGVVARSLIHKKKRPGKQSYLRTILRHIFTYRSVHYTIDTGLEQFTGKKLLVDISNGRRAGGGFHIAPSARADDGVLDLVLADALTPLFRLRYLPVIERGKHLGLPFIQHREVKKVRISATDPVPYHLDGEYGEAREFAIQIVEKAFLFRY